MKVAILCLVLSLAAAVSGQIYAVAVIRGTALDPNIRGTVTFTQPVAGGNVNVAVNINGIATNPNALHGIHIHTFGDLTDQAAAASAGGHWAGPNAHGCPEINGTSRHLGDTGNWQATNGSIVATKSLDLFSITGATSAIGRAVVIHANTDDCVNVPSSGGRLAFGVIGIVNSTAYTGSGEASQATPDVAKAICVLEPASGTNVTGVVYLSQTAGAGPVTVYAIVNGITGPHGFHLHWWGDITSATGAATGGHYNPTGKLHGVPPYATRHIGDMGIISYYENGTAYYKYTNDALSLNGPYSVIGRAIHVHQNSDDCVNPVGNGGGRWAQCVVGLSDYTLPTFPAALPETQQGNSICAIVYATTAAATTAAPTTAAATTGSPVAVSISMTATGLAPSVVACFATIFALLLLAL